MKSIFHILEDQFNAAIARVVPKDFGPVDPLIRVTTEEKFGDYQSNVAMGLAKKLKQSPLEIAQKIAGHLDLKDVCAKVEVVSPGFINLYVSAPCLETCLKALYQHKKLGVEKTAKVVKHIIDFSGPNLAKEMHVGHLRTTITGEVVARVIEFLGHPVERVNHVGDWGTQFGMLLAYIFSEQPEVVKNPEKFAVTDLEAFYQAAKKRFDEDESFAAKSRAMVVKLQSGDKTTVKIWQAFLKESLRTCHELYKILDVTLEDVGESFYNDRLPDIVAELEKLGLAKKDQGAVCVFLDGYQNREGEPLPMIIQKADGGYNYDTTDLAALKYRVCAKKAERLIYVTDLRQAQHFAMVFDLGRKAGWVLPSVDLCHLGYGMVLGADKKPFRTRDGGTVRLKALIQEGIERSKNLIAQNQDRKFSSEQIKEISQAVGLAAIKYADLSHNLSSDYVFDWDKMLAMDGNTGPYMLYAYARIRSIGRKAKVDMDRLPSDFELHLEHPKELGLAKILTRFPDVVNIVARDLKPNFLTDYLYTLSKAFSAFYDKKIGVSVLEAPTDELRNSRLLLCALTAKVLKQGLHLLSIRVVEEM